jgi:hypothetical protein
MTDRHAGYLITLDKTIRDDEAEATIAAIHQIRGVLTVEPVPADITLAMAQSRARHELVVKIYDALGLES